MELEGEGQEEGGSISTIDVKHERTRFERGGVGDWLPIFKNSFFTLLDKISTTLTLAVAPISPVVAKVINDGAYLRAMAGTPSLMLPILGGALGVWSVIQNQGEVLTPPWQMFLVIAVLGIFDAMAGFAATVIFVLGTIFVGGVDQASELRMMIGVLLVGFGPALLANAFRAIRKRPEKSGNYIWERIVDLGVLPFIGGWTMSSMVSTLPALAGLTLPVANHVADFAVFTAMAMAARVLLEEFVARTFPLRLGKLHPEELPAPPMQQKFAALLVRLALFVFVAGALMGNTWQTWVGSFLFILPTLLGWYSHRLPNLPALWRILPSGIPGLALSLIIASSTTAEVGAWLGASPDLAQWSFVILPIPMLLLSILGLFGRHGAEGEERFIKHPKLKTVYRAGGIVMLLITLRLAGVA
jgi:hypothetical protein